MNIVQNIAARIYLFSCFALSLPQNFRNVCDKLKTKREPSMFRRSGWSCLDRKRRKIHACLCSRRKSSSYDSMFLSVLCYSWPNHIFQIPWIDEQLYCSSGRNSMTSPLYLSRTRSKHFLTPSLHPSIRYPNSSMLGTAFENAETEGPNASRPDWWR
jgi:hypothetical protein